MMDEQWIQQRRTELQRDLHAALVQTEQLKGALQMLQEIESAMVVAAEGNGADATPE